MNSVPDEDWLDVLERTDFEPDSSSSNSYQSYRFVDLDIDSVTIENYKELLVGNFLGGQVGDVYTAFRKLRDA